MVFGDIIGGLEDRTSKEEHNRGGVLVEEPYGDDVFLADSNEDDVFVNFSFLQTPRPRVPKSNVVNPL